MAGCEIGQHPGGLSQPILVLFSAGATMMSRLPPIVRLLFFIVVGLGEVRRGMPLLPIICDRGGGVFRDLFNVLVAERAFALPGPKQRGQHPPCGNLGPNSSSRCQHAMEGKKSKAES